MAIQSAKKFMDRLRKIAMSIDDMDSARNKALAWNDLIEELTARDDAIRAEERTRAAPPPSPRRRRPAERATETDSGLPPGCIDDRDDGALA